MNTLYVQNAQEDLHDHKQRDNSLIICHPGDVERALGLKYQREDSTTAKLRNNCFVASYTFRTKGIAATHVNALK